MRAAMTDTRFTRAQNVPWALANLAITFNSTGAWQGAIAPVYPGGLYRFRRATLTNRFQIVFTESMPQLREQFDYPDLHTSSWIYQDLRVPLGMHGAFAYLSNAGEVTELLVERIG